MRLKMLVATAALILAIPASAHAPKPQHGGRVVEASSFSVEIVAQDNTVSIYLVDHDEKAVTVKGYKGLAILAVGGKSERVVLEPSDDAKLLLGKSTAALPKQLRGVVQITAPGGKVVSAKFD